MRRHNVSKSPAFSHQNNGFFNSTTDFNNSTYHPRQRYANFSAPPPQIAGLNPNAREFVPSGNVVPQSRYQRHSNNTHRVHSNSRRPKNDSEQWTISCESFRERLEQQLNNESYECMICCEKVGRIEAVWSCPQCFHVFHLHCVKKWARSSQLDKADVRTSGVDEQNLGWRCPGCQYVTDRSRPLAYFCFCGKIELSTSSSSSRFGTLQSAGSYCTTHSCGQHCTRERPSPCRHPCPLRCHPGPCPSCARVIPKRCFCGRVTEHKRCGAPAFKCTNVCDQMLNCNVHRCQVVCHDGDCPSCENTVHQVCFCGKEEKISSCHIESNLNDGRYSCRKECQKSLDCGQHRCQLQCHPGDCPDCFRSPETVTTCPCGKKSLKDIQPTLKRSSCLDPWPSCGGTCEKLLSCSDRGHKHVCLAPCHDTEPCPPCQLTSIVKCRCGSFFGEVLCRDLEKLNDGQPYLCDKRCGKKKSCKVHKCTEICCNDQDHLCLLTCNKRLLCNVHCCEQLCHSGKCRPCLALSFEELSCFCGQSVIYPPVPCGTKPPACTNSCTRVHLCSHPVTHRCHSEPSCPPCTFLVSKLCYGGHELRKNIPCHLEDVSCGKSCNRPLACKMHKCLKICHKGLCECSVIEGQTAEACNQPCIEPRPLCGHPCKAPCHVDQPCPVDTPCATVVAVTCKCGRVQSTVKCSDFKPLDEQRIDEDTTSRYKCLQCDDECLRLERNRRLIEALKLEKDPSDHSDYTPLYSENLKQACQTDPHFVQNVEKVFSTLIESLKKTKQTHAKENYTFPHCNRAQCQIIKDYATFYHIDTMTLSHDPMKSVVATATKRKSRTPYVLLSTVIKNDAKPKIILKHPSIESKDHIMPRVGFPTSFNTQCAASTSAVSDENSVGLTMTNLTSGLTVAAKRRVPPRTTKLPK